MIKQLTLWAGAGILATAFVSPVAYGETNLLTEPFPELSNNPGYTTAAPAGWSDDGNAGMLNKSLVGLGSGNDGMYYLDTGVVGTLVLTGTPGAAGTYTLTGQVFNRTDDYINSGTINFNLYLGGTLLTPAASSGSKPAAGSMSIYSRTYELTNPIPAGDITIKIGMTGGVPVAGAGNAQPQVSFDNLSLGFVAVPEPASLGLLVGAGLLLIRRRRA